MTNANISRLIIIVMVSATLMSCGLFRKKNRCNSCPKWSKTEQTQANQKV